MSRSSSGLNLRRREPAGRVVLAGARVGLSAEVSVVLNYLSLSSDSLMSIEFVSASIDDLIRISRPVQAPPSSLHTQLLEIQVDQLLRNDETTYEGRYYQVREARFRPRPIQQPRPPLTLGGHKPRMLRIVAEYADVWNSFGTVDEIRARNDTLNELCLAGGPNPRRIRRSLYCPSSMQPRPWGSVEAFHDMVGRYREAGIEELVLDLTNMAQFSVLERIATDAIPALRGDRTVTCAVAAASYRRPDFRVSR